MVSNEGVSRATHDFGFRTSSPSSVLLTSADVVINSHHSAISIIFTVRYQHFDFAKKCNAGHHHNRQTSYSPAAHQSPFLTIMLCTLCFISAMRFGSFSAAARSLGSGTAMPRCKMTVFASQCCQTMLPHILAAMRAAQLKIPRLIAG